RYLGILFSLLTHVPWGIRIQPVALSNTANGSPMIGRSDTSLSKAYTAPAQINTTIHAQTARFISTASFAARASLGSVRLLLLTAAKQEKSPQTHFQAPQSIFATWIGKHSDPVSNSRPAPPVTVDFGWSWGRNLAWKVFMVSGDFL